MQVTSARLSENSDVEYCSSCTDTIQSINSPKHTIVHHSSWDLTLPWYLILSCCCCCRKPGPPGPPPLAYDRILYSNFSSTFLLHFFTSVPLFTFFLLQFLSPQLSWSSCSLSGSLVRTKPTHSGQNTNSLSPSLFTPSSSLSFDRSSKCTPLLPSKLLELLLHVRHGGK